MTMMAIRLSEHNRARIEETAPTLPEMDLDAMIEEYGSRQDYLLFVPAYEDPKTGEMGGWATIPRSYLLGHYDLRQPVEAMNYAFVQISHK